MRGGAYSIFNLNFDSTKFTSAMKKDHYLLKSLPICEAL